MTACSLSTSAKLGPIRLEISGDLEPLRAALIQGGYTAEAMAATLGMKSISEGIDLPVLMRRTSEPTPYHGLTRLFFLGQSIDESLARQALAPMPLEKLLSSGLLTRHSEGIASTVKLVPHDDLYLTSDFSYPARSGPMMPDHVLGVGAASVTLSVLTLRTPAEQVLDVGCGAGFQALLAARHSQQVIGTDINSRALNLAEFNARLNGINNVSWRLGSFFDPVAHDEFDRIVANPPFVISPQSAYLYRDSGVTGDGVSEFVVKGSAAKLKEGGFASMLINWHHQTEDDWEQRPRQWVQGCGCDCWIIRSGLSQPLPYAASWLRYHESRDPERYAQLLDEWLDYFERLKINYVSAGAVILRKRSTSTPWVRFDTVDDVKGAGHCTPSIQRVFAAEDLLQGLSSDLQLLQQRLVLHPDLTATQKLVFHQGRWASESIELSMREGFPFSGKADMHILQLLANCTGREPLQSLVQELANSIGADFATIAPTCLEIVKKLLRSGMILCLEEARRNPA